MGHGLLRLPEGRLRKQPQLGLHLRTDEAPRGSAKEVKIAEDSDAIGGMRHPLLSVGKVLAYDLREWRPARPSRPSWTRGRTFPT